MEQINIISIEFVGFVLLTLAIYHLLPGRLPVSGNSSFLAGIANGINFITPNGLQNLFLLGASYFFYYTWSATFVWLLMGLTLFDYLVGIWLHASANNKKTVLWFGILTNIAILLWYLIGGPYLRTSDLPVETKFAIFPLIAFPVGMSYYALNGISYLIDISLRIAKPTTNLVDFALYLAYFPKLISGPLERARKFLPILGEKRTVDNAQIASSLTLILVGLLRAAILAGVFSLLLPGKPLENPAKSDSLSLIWAMVTLMFFIYNSFAGYTDIVRGVSGLYGIPLTRNFMHPFFSKDFSDFWIRWHISLSQWLRDYVYMPISRSYLRRNPSRNNIPNLIIPPLATMLASGLWHGATPNLALWGFLMGLFIVIENIRALSRPAVPQQNIPIWRRWLGGISLLALMLIATAPFDLDIKSTFEYYRQLILGWDLNPINFLPGMVIPISLLTDWIQSRSNDETVFQKWPVWAQVFLVVSITMGTIVIQQLQSAPSPFVYP